jgi:hypothetical protein
VTPFVRAVNGRTVIEKWRQQSRCSVARRLCRFTSQREVASGLLGCITSPWEVASGLFVRVTSHREVARGLFCFAIGLHLIKTSQWEAAIGQLPLIARGLFCFAIGLHHIKTSQWEAASGQLPLMLVKELASGQVVLVSRYHRLRLLSNLRSISLAVPDPIRRLTFAAIQQRLPNPRPITNPIRSIAGVSATFWTGPIRQPYATSRECCSACRCQYICSSICALVADSQLFQSPRCILLMPSHSLAALFGIP